MKVCYRSYNDNANNNNNKLTDIQNIDRPLFGLEELQHETFR